MTTERLALIGVYHRPWFHSDTTIALEDDGRYSMDEVSLGDGGLDGFHEVGLWHRSGGELTLQPSTSSKSVTSQPRKYHIAAENGILTLTQDRGQGPGELPFEKENSVPKVKGS